MSRQKVNMRIERELKLLADPGVGLPDLDGVVDGVTVGSTERLDLVAVYYDTPDFALLRSGITLRSRTGESGPTWMLKLPIASADGLLSRREISFDGKPNIVPPAAVNAVTAHSRRSKLVPVAEIQTERVVSQLVSRGAVVAMICNDRVLGQSGGSSSQFHEVEVELVDPHVGADLLKAVRVRLRDVGWRSDDASLSKVARVVGVHAVNEPVVDVRVCGRKARMGEVVDAAISRSVSELIAFDAGTRLDLDLEDLHQFRVAARRLRSDLRTFRNVLDRPWVVAVRAELRWLGEVVGAVRDLDVLKERLTTAIGVLSERDSLSAGLLMVTLEKERTVARKQMLEAISSGRYLDLLETLIAGAANLPLAPMAKGQPLVLKREIGAIHPSAATDGGEGGNGDYLADRLASEALPGLVRKPWKQLKGEVEELKGDSADQDLHDVRILAKRCRYAAEAASSVCGSRARRFAAAIKELQTVLGDYQDTVITEVWLRNLTQARAEVGLIAGLLIASEQEKRTTLRRSVDSVWRKASRPSLRAWLG